MASSIRWRILDAVTAFVGKQSVYEEWLLKTVGLRDQGKLDRLTRHLALGDPPEDPPDQV